jgi:hypothetical protein
MPFPAVPNTPRKNSTPNLPGTREETRQRASNSIQKGMNLWSAIARPCRGPSPRSSSRQDRVQKKRTVNLPVKSGAGGHAPGHTLQAARKVGDGLLGVCGNEGDAVTGGHKEPPS